MKCLPRRLIERLVMLGTPNGGAFAPVLALRGTYPFVRRLSRLDLAHSPEDLAARVFSTFPGLYQLLPAGATAAGIDLLDPACLARLRSEAGSGAARTRWRRRARRMADADARMAQIVGIDRETVISVRRTEAGFEYASDRNGDGTVPVSMARLPGARDAISPRKRTASWPTTRASSRRSSPSSGAATAAACRDASCPARIRRCASTMPSCASPRSTRSTGVASIRGSARRCWPISTATPAAGSVEFGPIAGVGARRAASRRLPRAFAEYFTYCRARTRQYERQDHRP